MLYINEFKSKFFTSENASILIPAAIAFPLITTVMLYTLDSSYLLNRRMNLLHAGDEASLAIATAGNSNISNDEKAINNALLDNYLKIYLPDAIDFPVKQISVTPPASSGSSSRYNIHAKAKFNTYLPTSDQTILLSYGGSASKSQHMDTDYILAVDVSFGVGSLNYLHDTDPLVRDIKKFIPEFTAAALSANPANRVAIMPNDVAIPQQLRGDDGRYLYNERGGPSVGCGYLFAPNKDFDIHYGFWSHQPFFRSTFAEAGGLASYDRSQDEIYKAYTSSGKDINAVTYEMDKWRYEYYEKYVLRDINETTRKEESLGTMEQLAKGQIPQLADKVKCTINDDFLEGNDKQSIALNRKTGHYRYSCSTVGEKYSNIFSTENFNIIKNEYERVGIIRDLQDDYASLLHGESIDYQRTVDNLFTLQPMIMKFNWGNRGSGVENDDYIDHGRRNPTFRPFNEVCHSIGWWGHRDRYVGYSSGNARIKDKNSSLMQGRMNLRNYKIDLTNNLAELAEFKKFQAFGHKHSGHALMYATYLARQGNNPRKVFIVFGLEFDETWRPAGTSVVNSTRGVTQTLLSQYGLCNRIRNGFNTISPNVERVDIYYVSINNSSDAISARNYWAENCVGGTDNVFNLQSQDDRDKLMKVINVASEQGEFAPFH